MHWNRGYRLVSYVRSSLWVVPFIAIVLEQIVIRVLVRLDRAVGWEFYGVSVHAAEVTFQAVITLTLSFFVFTFGSLLVAIQVASGQMTPRIIATTLLRDNVVRYSVGLFVFTMLFAMGALSRTGTEVNQFTLFVAAMLGLICIADFLYLIDYAARMLRPVSIVARVSENALAVIESVYPASTPRSPEVPTSLRQPLGPPGRIVHHQGTSGVVVAVNVSDLVIQARHLDGVIEFLPQVGDFVAVGDPIFRLFGGAGAVDDRELRAAATFGAERTLEQDPTFGFRILVDIAAKALSKAINDPTTAVVVIDQLHRLLRLVGKRHLHNENVFDGEGRLRAILRTPNWEDFVHLAFWEVRHYGAENIQVARRLRAMGENLIQSLPDYRHAALQRELALLDREIEALYPFPEDLALARIADSQGLGGASGTRAEAGATLPTRRAISS
ncbi:MAG: DUF2254 domain-containing protein [Rhodospirillum sp.]|jgi:uncharacterized membrane protein|nr:DUF2254 domain-containing protein [Rhodospirillum sp.]